MSKLTNKNKASKRNLGLLADVDQVGQASKKLTSDERSSVRFKIGLTDALENPFTFKKMKQEGIQGFSSFLSKTVGEKLTISEVENRFLRTDGPHGPFNKETINGTDRQTKHFDNGTRDFRVHGYYNDDGYFCIIRIDPHHRYKFK